ncbi:hypothetical protein [Fuerstiella marisgermanici]|uniref:Uncharacterized protein n=1 Tax=Fuerstiella marisgermanici TaxID=1891926 RepID=A0A1P8WAY4_9PLAN|nr:hypothetical protein [Fuerstiella marisgermanici]APZ91214.1 hypothetical protein Fuma_00800 [Fuerstiella marisgermanici]
MTDTKSDAECSAACDCSTDGASARDVAIDAALWRLALRRCPSITVAGFQKIGETVVFRGGYTVLLHGKPLAVVTLHGDSEFSINVFSP